MQELHREAVSQLRRFGLEIEAGEERYVPYRTALQHHLRAFELDLPRRVVRRKKAVDVAVERVEELKRQIKETLTLSGGMER